MLATLVMAASPCCEWGHTAALLGPLVSSSFAARGKYARTLECTKPQLVPVIVYGELRSIADRREDTLAVISVAAPSLFAHYLSRVCLSLDTVEKLRR